MEVKYWGGGGMYPPGFAALYIRYILYSYLIFYRFLISVCRNDDNNKNNINTAEGFALTHEGPERHISCVKAKS